MYAFSKYFSGIAATHNMFIYNILKCISDRAVDDCLSSVIHRVQSLSYQFEGRLELHIIGGFADARRISHQLSVSLLR